MEDKNDLDEVTNKDQVYKIAQSYANTGFDLLGNMMENKTEAVAELELIKEWMQISRSSLNHSR